ncbi:MAG TPA: DUF3775 domain-containing protein [Afifellaceae bacterium]|nr:DUF3775 domain-containing protein [Afifellaceae bacterium]
MASLDIDIDYLHMLILKVRAVMAREALDVPDPGGNPTDDEVPATLQMLPDDLSREEVVEEIRGLSETQQAELVALMWLGRDDGEPAEWNDLVTQAAERRETPAEDYLLGHPLLADYWAGGLERLGYESVAGGTGRIS